MGRTVHPDSNGYPIISLNGKTKKVHNLVWERHNGKKPSGMQINHKDGDKWNWDIENLELVTNKENQWHYRRVIKPVFVFYGEPMSVQEAIQKFGCKLSHRRVRARIKRHGWTPERALETPLLAVGRPKVCQ